MSLDSYSLDLNKKVMILLVVRSIMYEVKLFQSTRPTVNVGMINYSRFRIRRQSLECCCLSSSQATPFSDSVVETQTYSLELINNLTLYVEFHATGFHFSF